MPCERRRSPLGLRHSRRAEDISYRCEFSWLADGEEKIPKAEHSTDRFGVTDQLILEVLHAHKGLIRDGCYVPTRQEVAEAPPEKLWNWLLGWWWESPTELIPTDEQVADVLAVLSARADAATPAIRAIIAEAPPCEG